MKYWLFLVWLRGHTMPKHFTVAGETITTAFNTLMAESGLLSGEICRVEIYS